MTDTTDHTSPPDFTAAVAVLAEFLVQLPPGHPERPGVRRAMEVLTYEHTDPRRQR